MHTGEPTGFSFAFVMASKVEDRADAEGVEGREILVGEIVQAVGTEDLPPARLSSTCHRIAAEVTKVRHPAEHDPPLSIALCCGFVCSINGNVAAAIRNIAGIADRTVWEPSRARRSPYPVVYPAPHVVNGSEPIQLGRHPVPAVRSIS